MKLSVQDAKEITIDGVEFRFLLEEQPFCDRNFKWYPDPLSTNFESTEITFNELIVEKAKVIFEEAEYHVNDIEVFFYVSGTAIICFCDILNNKVVRDSVCLVRVPPMTVVTIGKGKGHCVPVTDLEDNVNAVVISAKKIETQIIKFKEKVVDY